MTILTDIIEPEVFNEYVIERTAELSKFRASGIIAPVSDITVPDGGTLVNMPFWGDLDGDDEVLSDSAPLGVGKIQAKQDAAIVLARGKAWGANDLSSAFSGDDVMAAIGSLVAEYWARREQAWREPITFFV